MESYIFATSAYCFLQAIPLLFSPRLMVAVLATSDNQSAGTGPTDLETYFARALALALVTLGLLIVPLTGMLPLSSMIAESEGRPSPYSTPTLIVTTTFHVASLVAAYVAYTNPSPSFSYSPQSLFGGGGFTYANGSVCFAAGMSVSSVLAAWGVLLLVFGPSMGSSIGKKTSQSSGPSGKDNANASASTASGQKHGSGWPFSNQESEAWKQERREARRRMMIDRHAGREDVEYD